MRENATPRSALVTGGAGFIGGHLVEGLVSEGFAVRVLDDFSTGREENLVGVRDRIELEPGDVRDETRLARLLEGVDVVFHLAAIPSVPRSVAEPLATHRVNVEGTLALLCAARAAGVRRVVYASSCAVYGDGEAVPRREEGAPSPRSPYALQKYEGELYCERFFDLFGLETVALRYFNVFGPRQDPQGEYAAVIPRFAQACLEGEIPCIHGDGEQTRDFLFVEDAVRATLLAADAPRAAGRVLNVGTGRGTSVSGVLGVVLDATGAEFEPRFGPKRSGDVRHSVADPTLAREILGFEAEVDIHEGVRRIVKGLARAGSAQPAVRGSA